MPSPARRMGREDNKLTPSYNPKTSTSEAATTKRTTCTAAGAFRAFERGGSDIQVTPLQEQVANRATNIAPNLERKQHKSTSNKTGVVVVSKMPSYDGSRIRAGSQPCHRHREKSGQAGHHHSSPPTGADRAIGQAMKLLRDTQSATALVDT